MQEQAFNPIFIAEGTAVPCRCCFIKEWPASFFGDLPDLDFGAANVPCLPALLFGFLVFGGSLSAQISSLSLLEASNLVAQVGDPFLLLQNVLLERAVLLS